MRTLLLVLAVVLAGCAAGAATSTTGLPASPSVVVASPTAAPTITPTATPVLPCIVVLGADPVTTIVYSPVIDAAGCARVLAAEAATGYPVHLGTAIPAGSPVCELSSDAGSFGPWSLGSVYGPVEVAKRICASMTATPSPTAA